MKFFSIFVMTATILVAGLARADNHVSEEQMAAIEKLLADLRCEVTGEIEVEDGEIELDDVICAGGQFDIEMNEELHITGARPE